MLSPGNPLDSARALYQKGDYAGASAAWQRATRGGRNTFESDVVGARIQFGLNNLPQARFLAERAAASAGADARRLATAAGVLGEVGLNAQGVEVYRKAVKLAPKDPGIAACLVGMIFRTGRYDEAMEESTRAMREFPGNAEVGYNHATLLNFYGRLDEAAATLRASIAANPQFVAARSNLCMLSNYLTGDPAELLAVHREYGAMLERAHTAAVPPYANSRDPERTIRLGVVSGDLRRGSVMSFFEPVLEHMDPARVETFVYSLHPAADEVTAKLRARSKSWKHTGELSPAALAQEVFGDRVDVLLDLGGHTAYNRLTTFHLRPAPVQMTYLAYPCTTGVSAIDYRLVDSRTDPVGAERFAAERLLRLDPCFLCFLPAADSPPVRTARPDGPFVFGSFNNAFKLHPSTLDAWARILRAVPESKLLLKSQGLDHPALRQACLARLTSGGLDPSRIEIAGFARTHRDHLAMYHRVDLALDSFPYNGTTTTCEALWMGVPVLTVAGACHAARVSASILETVSASSLITPDVEAYIAEAVRLAADRDRLGAASRGLRERVAASTLCDAPGFARRFEAALRTGWRAWCEGRPASA